MIDNTYNLIKKSMDASVLRQQVISHNIANVNTKGYKRFDVVFEEKLNSKNDDIKVTNNKHIRKNGQTTDVEVVRDESSSMRKDGNNVDVDNEMVNLAANSLMYNALVSEFNNRIAMTRNVIRGGK